MVTKQIADGYAVMLQDRINHGWDACLLSFMFNSLPGNDRTKVKLMMEEVRATYHKLLTRLYRHPHSKRHDQLPFLIAAPDYQVPKHDRNAYVNPEINNGLHIHAAIACPRLPSPHKTQDQLHHLPHRLARPADRPEPIPCRAPHQAHHP